VTRFAITLLMALALPGVAQASTGQAPLSTQQIFALLFLMLGPMKILGPFAVMTRGTDAHSRRSLAMRAVLFSAAALLVAGLLGHRMLLNFNIPVLALTSGLVLFLTALQAVLQQFDPPSPVQSEAPKPGLTLAINPLAFPTIVIPYGIAAMIIFVTLAENDPAATATLAGLVVLILFLDWLAMPYAHTILKYAGTALQFFRRGAGRGAGGAGADDYPAKPEPHRGVHAAGSEHDGFRFAHAPSSSA